MNQQPPRKKPNPNKRWLVLAKLFSLLILGAFFVFMFFFSIFFTRTTESTYDNDLQKPPVFNMENLLSGEFTNQLSRWFTDTIHGRDAFRRSASRIKAYYGVQAEEQHFGNSDFSYEDVSLDPIIPVSKAEESEEPAVSVSEELSSEVVSSEEISSTEASSAVSVPEESSEPVSEATQPEEIINDIVIVGEPGLKRAMEVFYYTQNGCLNYANKVNAFAEAVPSGVRVFSMVIPKQCAYYLHLSQSSASKEGYSKQTDETIRNALTSKVTYVDVYGALDAHKSEEIYARTDHHWTGLGAYYAAQAFAQTAGTDFADLSTFQKKVRPNYVGTMYKFTDYSPAILNSPEDFVTYVPGASYTATYYDQNFKFYTKHDIFWEVSDTNVSDWYSTYIYGDSFIVQIDSDVCKNGKTLFIIKDSYGNALSPYFLNSYEHVYIADLRQIKVNAIDFIRNNQVDDVLFAMCGYSAVGSSVNKYIDTIRTQ